MLTLNLKKTCGVYSRAVYRWQNLAFLDELACKINYSQQRYYVVILVLGGDTTPIVIVISKSLCLTKVCVNFHPNQVTLNMSTFASSRTNHNFGQSKILLFLKKTAAIVYRHNWKLL